MSLRLTYLRNKGYVTEDGDLRHTKVTNFCLPMYDIHRLEFGENLINVYIQHEVDPYLYIVVLNKDEPMLVRVLTRISSNEHFDSSYPDDDNNELVFKIKVPDKYIEDYYKIIAGRYSEISLEFKTKLTSKLYYGNYIYNLNEPPLIVNGQVATTMFEILNPSLKKKQVIAKHFGVEVSSVIELIEKPNLRYELYKKASDLFNEEVSI